MAKMTGLQKLGIAILLVSLVAGFAGTLVSIYLSFAALDKAENAGIGAVGDHITHALVFTVGGLIGAGVGLVVVIVGRPRT